MAYQIETITAQDIIGMIFNFWGNVTLLKEEKSGRLFSKYYLKSKDTPIAPIGWSFELYQFPQEKKILIKKGKTIDRIQDELGNIYYEVTSIIP